jgi:hypothetical protein
VADEKTESGLEVGTSVTEVALDVAGYRLSETDDQGEPQSEEISLVLAESGNEIIFYYQKLPVLTDYTVRYLDKDTGASVADDKYVGDKEVGTSVTECAIPVGGYHLSETDNDGNSQSEEITIELIDGENVIIFYYEQQPVLTDYVVKYLDVNTNEPVADEKTESGLEVGTSVTETAIPVDGYTAVGFTVTTRILEETGNVIIFYYQKLTF